MTKPIKIDSADSFNLQGQPNLEVQRLAVRVRQLEQELAQWRTWGVVEIAVRNANVAEYCEHWKGRALKAERDLDESRQQIADLTEAPRPMLPEVRE